MGVGKRSRSGSDRIRCIGVSVPQSGLTAAADMHPHAGAVGDDVNRKTRNWKLIVDPLLQKGGQKVYRTEGLVAGV